MRTTGACGRRQRTRTNTDEPYYRSVLRGSEDLPVLKRCGGRRRLSGPSQGDAAAKVDEDRGRGGGGGVRARAEEQWREEEEEWLKARRADLFIRASSWARESRRPRRGYLPTKRLDFRDDSKDKIHCGSGGGKNGLNGR